MRSDEVRTAFLEFFEKRGHRVVRSSSLIPAGDPTLLFTNAGMNQFKDVFLGKETRDYRRAASSQKCVRAGGKHNDLENVGRTARHQTFFEMLGNFSFGDYFKEEAIAYAWEFLTREMGLAPERMVATIFQGENGIPRDDEAARLWKKWVPEDRILEYGMHDNFWAMGDTGPCGPCSEVHYFQGNDLPCAEEDAGRTCLGPACECDRWVEVWNLVFMQYNRDDEGNRSPLPAPCVDTGMGLERLLAVVEGKTSNYDTDLLLPIIKTVAERRGKRYGESAGDDVSLRVIADHSRAAVFLVSDGMMPSNEGRGYVLRKIIRRAARHGKMLGFEKPFLHELVETVGSMMGRAYPEIVENAATVKRVILREEEVFDDTLALGMAKLHEAARELPPGEKAIPGEVLFKLYDTFGFPLDLAGDIAEDMGFSLDMKGFDEAMARQKELARQSWKGEMDTQKALELQKYELECRFLGYETLKVDHARCLLILKDGEPVETALAGDTVEIAFDQTPFYAESGGQVGDRGRIEGERGKLRVLDTQKPMTGVILHQAEVVSGEIRKDDAVSLHVDAAARAATMAHHTATHLLHASLREVLGSHVKQAGSLVAPTHLRFDFHHFSPLESDVLAAVEERVNEQVLRNAPVEKQVMPIDEAVSSGAMALFGEKYGDEVRVVTVPDFSKELCGGTHVERTGDIGLFKITQERSVSAGVRRIEAVAHFPLYRRVQEHENLIEETGAILKVGAERVPETVARMQKDLHRLEKEVSRLKLQLASGGGSEETLTEVEGVKLMTKRVDGLTSSEIKNLADSLRSKVKSGVVVIGNSHDGKAGLLAALTPDLVPKLHAGKLVRDLGKIIGGGGGGKPDLAEAGGRFPEKLDDALSRAAEVLKSHLSGSSS